MYAGKIVEIGDARDVFRNPQHSYTRELLRSTISLSTTGLEYIDGAPPDLVEPPPACRFHPRCPDAMNICATEEPVDREHATSYAGNHRAACWAADLRDEQVTLTDDEAQPLEREAISVAEEA
jgi:peptide/nickel transport system ATP-binding protein